MQKLLPTTRALARRDRLLDHIDFGEGRAEALPLPDGAVDVALSSTVFEEGDAELMLSEIVRVTRPGGRVGITVRAIDMPFWTNLPLDPALKVKVDAPQRNAARSRRVKCRGRRSSVSDPAFANRNLAKVSRLESQANGARLAFAL